MKTWLREAAAVVQVLHLYGAAGIAAFGWGLGSLIGWDAGWTVLLWFCGALFIYNADRLRRDPADAINVPERTAASHRHRAAGVSILIFSAALLAITPFFSRSLRLPALVLGGAFLCLNYSWPLLGFRFKDVPLLKSLFAPTVVTAAVLALPWLDGHPVHWSVAGWCWCFLQFNMLLCDLRDLDGDRRTGIRSLPVLLGDRPTRRLLGVLLIATILCENVARQNFGGDLTAWRILGWIAPLYLTGLLLTTRSRRSESFYEWWVEGMLFLPSIAAILSQRGN
jgi:4-hydroxybenzoate polyprenyltransferase